MVRRRRKSLGRWQYYAKENQRWVALCQTQLSRSQILAMLRRLSKRFCQQLPPIFFRRFDPSGEEASEADHRIMIFTLGAVQPLVVAHEFAHVWQARMTGKTAHDRLHRALVDTCARYLLSD